MTGPPAPGPRRMRRWQRWLLVVSLGVNLLILGIVAGAVLNRDGPMRAPRIDLSIGPFTRALPDEARRAVVDRMRAQGFLTRDGRDAMRADAEELLALIAAESFDPTAVDAVLERQRGRLAGFQNGAQEAFVHVLSGMSPQDRRAFAERLAQQMRHGPHDRD
ncbi:MAG: putative integral membrane protein [Rhodobacteraceae bacterium HLUCCA08]|nr:MAG: putative integral membrane protein [Rhodobacteraceae bacterium HLUCCA08]